MKNFYAFKPLGFSASSGASHLVLVLVTATIMTLLAFSIQIITFLQTRQAAGSQQTKTAYFASEGAMFETIGHLRNDLNWPPSFPHTDTYFIQDSDITRTLTQQDGLITIEINASNKGAKRKLVSKYQRQSEDTPPLDVILVIDRSGSMGFRNDPNKPSGIEAAKSASHAFLDILENSSNSSQVGLVAYNHHAQLNQQLTPIFNDLRDQIDSLHATNGTNIGEAINYAYQELDAHSRSNTNKIIVVLSDGVAQRSTRENGQEVCHTPNQSICTSNACLSPDSGFAPQNQGNCCSQNAIEEAAIAKDPLKDYLIFSVSLGSNYTHSVCGNLERTINLGRLTMLRLSSENPNQNLPSEGEQLTYFKETNDPDQLEALFADIAGSISSPEFFSYIETEPDPD